MIIQSKISEEDQKKSGIYVIKNSIDTRIYIGSTIDFNVRLYNHENLLKRGKHNSIHLQRFYNKYGKGFLWIEVLEICDADKLIKREQYYLNTLFPFGNKGFNGAKIANSCLGVKHTEESKKNMSIGQKNRGKFPEEHRKKLSSSSSWTKNPIYGKKRTQEEKLKIAASLSRPLVQFGSTGEFIRIWDSAYEASIELGVSKERIRKVAKSDNSNLYAGSYKWRFLYDEKLKSSFSEERISKTLNGKRTKIHQLNGLGIKVAEFSNLNDASNSLKMNKDTIGKAILSGKELNGFIFKRQ